MHLKGSKLFNNVVVRLNGLFPSDGGMRLRHVHVYWDGHFTDAKAVSGGYVV